MEEATGRPPGLRTDDNGRPFWRATKAAVKAGYPVKSVNLASLADNERLLRDRCIKLQREMLEWLSNGERRAVQFDGTFLTLLDVYHSDPKSTYSKLKHSSRAPYDVYIRMMRAEIGKCRLDRTDGVEVLDWFEAWAEPDKPGGKRQVAKARMAIAVLKAALTFGVMRRLSGCAEFRAVLDAMKGKFPGVASRKIVLTAEQVAAARQAAHEIQHPRAALAYALQYEGVIRQWDVKGQWMPIGERQPSAVIYKGKKWIGPTWANVDEHLILRWTPTKTETTTAPEIVVDLRACPMVMEELEFLSQEARRGPLIVNLETGRPYTEDRFNEIWREVARAAGIPKKVWNRDLRKSGSTEARQAGAPIDDLKKLMGHTAETQVTADVYDMANLEAHRRIAAARKVQREKK
jgi:integrase